MRKRKPPAPGGSGRSTRARSRRLIGRAATVIRCDRGPFGYDISGLSEFDGSRHRTRSFWAKREERELAPVLKTSPALLLPEDCGKRMDGIRSPEKGGTECCP